MPFIHVINYKESSDELRCIYDNIIQTRGKLAEVHKIQSLNPKSIIAHMDLYMTIMFGQSPLKRYQREMLAVVVSKTNRCSYCQIHHVAALQFFWKDKNKIERFCSDFRSIDLSEIDSHLCEFAQKLTRNPETDQAQVDKLKNLGLSERAILDATLIISYFNFVNRIVIALAVAVEKETDVYKYE